MWKPWGGTRTPADKDTDEWLPGFQMKKKEKNIYICIHFSIPEAADPAAGAACLLAKPSSRNAELRAPLQTSLLVCQEMTKTSFFQVQQEASRALSILPKISFRKLVAIIR